MLRLFVLLLLGVCAFAQNGLVVDGILNGSQINGTIPASSINPGGCAAGYYPNGTYTAGVANCSQVQASQVVGLGGAATLNVGTGSSTVAAGNDSRFLNATSLSGTSISGLTGLIKLTAGVPSIGASTDVISLFSGTCNSTTALYGDGSCKTASGGSTTYTAPGTGAVSRTITSKLSDIVNVLDYGAVGNGQADTTASITSGSKNLTITDSKFAAGDVGKYITVEGAGASAGPLVTTIATYTDANHVVLTAASSTAVTGAGSIFWGTDDTTAFTNAIAAAVNKTLLIPATGGQYEIGDLTIPSYTSLKLLPGAYVMAKGGLTQNSTSAFTLFNLTDVNHVNIVGYGATIAMPFVEYNYEYNHCINVQGSSDIDIEGVYLNGCGGDGIYLAGDGTAGTYSSLVTINKVWADHVHRNGISIISVKGVKITNSKLTSDCCDGDASTYNNPGLDVEPNATTDLIQDIDIANLTTGSNKGAGVSLSLSNMGAGSAPVSISIDSLYSDGDGYGALQTSASVAAFVPGSITVRHLYSVNSGNYGMWLHNWNIDDPLLDIIEPTIVNANSSVSAQEGFSIDQGGGNTLKLGNIAVHGATVIDTRGTSKTNWPYVAADYSNIGASNIIVTLKYVSGVTNGYQNEGPTYSVEEPYLQTLATPIFDASVRSDENNAFFHVTLNKAMSGTTLINAKPGQILTFQICQGSTAYTFAWPSSLHGATTVGSTINKCSTQQFAWYNTFGTAIAAGNTNQ